MAVTPQAPPGGPDAEALFKEARRLRRLRRLTAAGILLAAAAGPGLSGRLVPVLVPAR